MGRAGGGICGSGTGILRGCGDSPALGSGLQLPMQSHREAKEAPWLALLAQGAHHVQIEGDSPWEEQSGKQGAKKVTNARGPPWIAARSPCHGATPERAPGERKEIRSRPESQVSRDGSLVSESRWSFRGSPSLRLATPLPPLRRPRTSQDNCSGRNLWSTPAPASAPTGAAPAPPSPRPSAPLQVEAAGVAEGCPGGWLRVGTLPAPPHLGRRPRQRSPFPPTPALARERWRRRLGTGRE